jgi:hypothetical protein
MYPPLYQLPNLPIYQSTNLPIYPLRVPISQFTRFASQSTSLPSSPLLHQLPLGRVPGYDVIDLRLHALKLRRMRRIFGG